jgi:diacylglycerol kinase
MIQRMIRSFGYAFAGIRYVFKTQPNFRFHTISFIAVVTAGCYFKLSAQEWLWLLAASGAVFVTEMFNTSIETIVDLVSPDYHKKAKIAKDVAAAAVLAAALIAVVIGMVIFIPKIMS